jgi:hypothetical protein
MLLPSSGATVKRGVWCLALVTVLAGCGGGDYLPPPRKSAASDEEEAAASPAVAIAQNTTTTATTPKETETAPKTETKPSTVATVSKPEPEKMISGAGRALAAKESPSGGKPRTAEPRKGSDDDEENAALPSRPLDTRQWTPDDFRSAKRENDPRLTKAITEWAANHVNDDAAGQLIVEILEAPDKSAPAERATFNVESSGQAAVMTDDDGFPIGGASATDRRPNPQLAEACVAALGVNGSAAARKGLRRALLGNMATDLTDKRLVEGALKALATNRHPNNEDVLLTVLVKADRVRPALIGDLDAAGLQEECLKQIRNQSSAAFRRRIAVELQTQNTSGVLREKVVAWLMSPDFVNLPAQSVVYASRNCDLDSRRKLEKIFAPYAKDAVTEALARSGGADYSGGAGDTSARSTQIATEFLAPEFTKALAERVRGVGDLNAEKELLAFATSMPSAEVRRETALLLKRRWSSGAKAWEKSQVDVTKFLDPGLLLAVKAIPREDSLAHKSPLGDKAEKPKLVKSENAEVLRFQAEKKAKEEWMTATEQMVKAINDRLRAASQGALNVTTSTNAAAFDDCTQAVETTDDDAAETSAGGLPLRLPAAAHVINEFHLEWPRQWPSSLGGTPAPELVVHYVRMEQEERVSGVQGFYRRQLKKPEARFIKQGNWLESVERVAETGRLRSVDVTITRPTEAPPRDRTAKEPLIVDVLWIEVPDFTR